MSTHEYAPMAGDSRVLYHCLSCGSLVVNMARHDRWHTVIENSRGYPAGTRRTIIGTHGG